MTCGVVGAASAMVAVHPAYLEAVSGWLAAQNVAACPALSGLGLRTLAES